MIERIVSKQDRRDFLDMCRRLINNKVEKKRIELDKIDNKKKNPFSIIDDLQKQCDKEMKNIGIKYTALMYSRLGPYLDKKLRRKSNLFKDEYGFDFDTAVEDIVGDYDEWADKEEDKYRKKLEDKLFSIEQEIIFADMPRLEKLFNELKNM